MSKILLFSSAYKSSGSANGICARNLVREFVKQGHDVFVIAVPEDNRRCTESLDGAEVWFEPDEWYVRVFKRLNKDHSGVLKSIIFKIFNLIRILVYGPLFPNDCRNRVRGVVELSDKLIKKHGIDTIIGTCQPYDGIQAAVNVKKKYGQSLRVITYHFDIMAFPNNKSSLVKSFKKWKTKRYFSRELEIVDHVFLPETAKGLYSHPKITIVGFPVYIKDVKHVDSDFSFPKESINISYIGSLDNRNRPPQPAIDFVRGFNEKTGANMILHIWGVLADTETQNVINESKDCVVYHGMLKNSETFSVMMKSDYLLNISNTILYKFLPSKIFSMFATGKPIINIVAHPDDCTLSYFEKYGNVKQIKIFVPEDDDKYILVLDKQITVPENLFEEYTPSYIVGRLMNN